MNRDNRHPVRSPSDAPVCHAHILLGRGTRDDAASDRPSSDDGLHEGGPTRRLGDQPFPSCPPIETISQAAVSASRTCWRSSMVPAESNASSASPPAVFGLEITSKSLPTHNYSTASPPVETTRSRGGKRTTAGEVEACAFMICRPDKPSSPPTKRRPARMASSARRRRLGPVASYPLACRLGRSA